MTLKLVAAHIYRDEERGTLYERPKIAGRWTYRALKARTIKLAKEERDWRRREQVKAEIGQGRDPYAPPPATVAALVEQWEKAGWPTIKLRAREGRAAEIQSSFIKQAVEKLGNRPAEKLTSRDLTAYAESRRPYTRAADCEVQALITALKWAYRTHRLAVMPDLSQRTRLHTYRTHARDMMPRNAGELSAVARWLFERTPALGFQFLLEALTGCRTSEVLSLRWDAGPREPGYIEGEWLWVSRLKQGVNPFALIHPVLRQVLDVCRGQKGDSPWFIPGFVPGQHMNEESLSHALDDVPKELCDHPLTSHGLRAYYVTVRRSQGVSDGQIAAEIGDSTGPAIIASTYGQIPPNWQRNGGTMEWLEGEPWKAISGGNDCSTGEVRKAGQSVNRSEVVDS